MPKFMPGTKDPSVCTLGKRKKKAATLFILTAFERTNILKLRIVFGLEADTFNRGSHSRNIVVRSKPH